MKRPAGARQLLERMIQEDALEYRQEPFTLASGKQSNFYFDLRRVSGRADGLHAMASAAYEIIRARHPKAASVGGLESGSIPIAAAVSQYSHIADPNSALGSFYVRKEAKGHGKGRRIEGRPESPVIIIDDVITTGGSAAAAAEAARQEGYEVAGIMCIVYRGTVPPETAGLEFIFDERHFVDLHNAGPAGGSR